MRMTLQTRLSSRPHLSAALLLPLILSGCGDQGGDQAADTDPQVAAGQAAFQTCSSCHIIDEERHRAGPHLVDLFGREAGGAQGFRYSSALTESGIVWDEQNLDDFLANPRGLVPGNRMSFAGLRNADERAAIIAYLRDVTPAD